jgi:hypothetical protein
LAKNSLLVSAGTLLLVTEMTLRLCGSLLILTFLSADQTLHVLRASLPVLLVSIERQVPLSTWLGKIL